MFIKSLIRLTSVFVLVLSMGISPLFVSTAKAQSLAALLAGNNINGQRTAFTGPYGAPISVDYYLPENATCPMPAVVVFHGSDGGRKYADAYHKVGKALAVQGYAAFLVNYFEGAPHMPLPDLYVNTFPHPETFEAWKRSAQAGLTFVSNFPGIDRSRIGVMGFSLGGFIGSSIATEDSRINSLVILSGGLPPHEFGKIHRNMAKTLVIHGNQDPDVPVAVAYSLNNALKAKGVRHQIFILDCEGHLPYRKHQSFVTERVSEFLERNL